MSEYLTAWRAEHPEYQAQWLEEHPGYSSAAAKRQEERHPEKVNARQVLRQAVKSGVIHKPPCCEGCGTKPESRDLHGHHEDYSKPLEVEWLCRSCHVARHQGGGE